KKERWAWLKALPATEELGDILLAHGTPDDNFTYVTGMGDALRVFQRQMGEARICFIGHTHVPGFFFFDGRQLGFGAPEPEKRYGFHDKRLLINVGSVGQPRDHDPRACYVLLHGDQTFEYRRVEYDCERT